MCFVFCCFLDRGFLLFSSFFFGGGGVGWGDFIFIFYFYVFCGGWGGVSKFRTFPDVPVTLLLEDR